MNEVAAADDRFHPPTSPDPTWGETAWFGFATHDRGLGGTIYPLFRQGLGVCALGVAVWDEREYEPWRVRYARKLWHLPMPDAELDDCSFAGLTLRCVEPLTKYHLRYEDADRIALDLHYSAIMAPHVPIAVPERGHVDQLCHVTGTLQLGKESIAIDAFEMRDRSWGPRDDTRRTRASYCYGIVDERESFLASTMDIGGTEQVIMGFLIRDGVKHDLASGTREVLERHERGYPLRVRIAATDREGRELEVIGTTRSRFADQATPGMFDWMSLTRWEGLGGDADGQDQEVWSPDTWPVP